MGPWADLTHRYFCDSRKQMSAFAKFSLRYQTLQFLELPPIPRECCQCPYNSTLSFFFSGYIITLYYIMHTSILGE